MHQVVHKTLVAAFVFIACTGTLFAQAPAEDQNKHTIIIEIDTYPADFQVFDTLMVSPLWLGFHDGSFDIIDIGEPASASVAEFAKAWSLDPEGLDARFNAIYPDGISDLIKNIDWQLAGTGLDPSNEASFRVEPSKHRFLSFLGRLTPSNDGIVGNDDPHAIELFTEEGHWKGTQVITVYGSEVLDAGVLQNNEQAVQFLDTEDPGESVATEDLVGYHPGYHGSVGRPNATPVNILGGTYTDPSSGFMIHYDPATTDFTQKNFRVMEITVTSTSRDGRHSGAWYNPERDGEGFSIHVIDRDNPKAVIHWFTYKGDGSGEQLWMIGVDELNDGDQTVAMHRFTGGEFGSTDNPELTMGELLGELELVLDSCRDGRIAFTPSAGSELPAVSYDIERLTAPSIGFEDECP